MGYPLTQTLVLDTGNDTQDIAVTQIDICEAPKRKILNVPTYTCMNCTDDAQAEIQILSEIHMSQVVALAEIPVLSRHLVSSTTRLSSNKLLARPLLHLLDPK
jgi:hypothetical protein